MSNQLPEEYWDSLGDNGVFLRTLLSNQAGQLEYLQHQNQLLQSQLGSIQSNLANAASAAAIATTQHMAVHIPSPTSPSHCSIKAADPEKFSGDRADTEGFIHAVKLSIAIQLGSFPDDKTKMLYALSFMSGGSVAIWAHNITQAIIDGTSLITTFDEFTKQVEEAFGDPDRARTACTKLHDLRMMSNMSADEYTAQFEILAGRTGFNDEALEDAYARGLPAMILDKIHAQPLLPSNLKAWKEATCQIDCNHCHLLEVRLAHTPQNSNRTLPVHAHSTPVTSTPNTATPMDLDSNRRRAETRTCYNCGKQGHISPACPEPRKEHVRMNITETPLASMVSESVAAALDAREAVQKARVQTSKEGEKQDFRQVSGERH